MAATVSSSQAPTTKVYFNLQTSSEESIWNCINIISQNNRSATNSIQSVIKKIDQRTFNLTSLDVDPRIRKLLDRLCRHAHHLKKLDESFLKSLQETPPIIWNTKCVKPYFTISQEIHQVTVPLIVLFLQDLKAKKPLSKTHEVAIAPSDTESFSSLLEKCCCNLQQAKETHRRFLHTLEKLPAFNETAFKQTTAQFKFPQDTLPTISKSKLTDLISRLEKNEHLTWKTGLTEIAYLAKWMIQSDPSLSSNTSEALIFSQAAIQHPTALLNILKKCLYTIDTYYPSLSTSSSPSSSQPSVFPDTPCKLKIGTRSFSVPTTQSFHLNDTKLNLLKSVYEKLSRADQTADVHTQTTPEERQRIYDMIDWLHGYEDPEIVTDTAREDYKQYYQYNIPKLLDALKIALIAHGKLSTTAASCLPAAFPKRPSKLKIGTHTFSVPTTQSLHLNDTKLNLLKSVYEKLSRADQTADAHTQTTEEERQRIYDMIDWLHGYEDPEIVTDTARDDYKQYYQYNIPKLLKALKITLMTHGQMS